MELKRVSKTSLNISSEAEVLSYTYDGSTPIEVIARVDLGLTGGLLSGVGGVYQANMYLDGATVVPLGDVIVPAGKTKAIIVSKSVPLEVGDEVSIKVTGLSGDTSISTVATLRDATPVRRSDVLGPGAILVDHDYGGDDALAYKEESGAGVSGAEVRAYTREDYDAGLRSDDYLVARANTGAGGRWTRGLMLEPGSYTLIYFKSGAFGPDRKDLTVS